MRHEENLIALPWPDYELLDSGENMKLERFGEVVLARPETQAVWKKSRPKVWGRADATFTSPSGPGEKGTWEMKRSVPKAWELAWGPVRFTARLTGFKHVGIFPEQAANWQWISERCHALREPKILNLFGYTGIASLVAAEAGASVTHVDASKQSLDWAHENARLSKLGEDKIRWISDDVLSFVKREVRRGAKYDGIVLDPPAFGRGTKGEVWKVERDLAELLHALTQLLAEGPGSFFLLNGYAAGYSSRSFTQAVEGEFNHTVESGEMHIKESGSERVIPSGIYVRFVR